MTRFLPLLLLSLMAWVSQASATNFYWTTQTAPGQQFPSADAACRSKQSSMPYLRAHILSSGTVANCIFDATGQSSNPEYINGTASRQGTTCGPNTTYNALTGACDPDEPPPQECPVGNPFLGRSNGPIVGAPRAFVASSSPGPICRDGCRHGEGTERPTSCYRNPDPGQTGQGFCNYVLLSTGESCSGESGTPGGTGPALNPEPPTDPEEPPSDPDNPCSGVPGYVWTGSTCIKDPGPDGGGDGGDGGEGDGGDGDGSGDGDGGGNNGGGDGGGDSGGGEGGDGGDGGDGTGPGDDGTGSTDGGNGNGNGNGDGDGDGDGDGEGEGDGSGGPVGGAGCEGEACSFQAPEGYGDDTPSISQSLQRLYTDIGKSPIANAVAGIQFPTGGTCPQGSVSLFNTSITFDSHCQLWGQIAPILSAVFLAFWCLLAVRVFLSA